MTQCEDYIVWKKRGNWVTASINIETISINMLLGALQIIKECGFNNHWARHDVGYYDAVENIRLEYSGDIKKELKGDVVLNYIERQKKARNERNK